MAGSYKRTVGGVSEWSSYLRIGEAGAGPPFKEWLKRTNRSLPSMPLQPKAAITRGPALSYLDSQGLDGFGPRGHYSLGTAMMCFHRMKGTFTIYIANRCHSDSQQDEENNHDNPI